MVPFYSYAGRASGKQQPDEIRVVDATDDEDYPVEEPDRFMEDHMLIMWSGGEYSLKNTWMSAHSKDVIDLEEHR